MALALESIDGLVCDLDGVVYLGDEPIAGAIATLQELGRHGIGIVFCSNNSSHTVEAYVDKLTAMGLEVAPENVLTSAVVAKEVLQERCLAGAAALVVGGRGLRTAIEGAGLTITDDPARAEIVVVGRDPNCDFDLIARAADAVRGGAIFWATNDDATYPTATGVAPGAGSLLAAIEVAGGRKAEVLGKPHRPMMERAARRFAPTARLVMVGDRPDTDLAGAASMGWTTVLVLSGVTKVGDLEGVEPEPDYVIESLADLFKGARQ